MQPRQYSSLSATVSTPLPTSCTQGSCLSACHCSCTRAGQQQQQRVQPSCLSPVTCQMLFQVDALKSHAVWPPCRAKMQHSHQLPTPSRSVKWDSRLLRASEALQYAKNIHGMQDLAVLSNCACREYWVRGDVHDATVDVTWSSASSASVMVLYALAVSFHRTNNLVLSLSDCADQLTELACSIRATCCSSAVIQSSEAGLHWHSTFVLTDLLEARTKTMHVGCLLSTASTTAVAPTCQLQLLLHRAQF